MKEKWSGFSGPGSRVSGPGGEMRMKSPKRPHRSHNGDQYSSADSGLYGFIDM